MSFTSAQRYANKLLNNLVVVEYQDIYKNLYSYATDSKEMWNGFNIDYRSNNIASPIFQQTDKRMQWGNDNFVNDSLFSFKIGRRGYFADYDSVNSYYIGDQFNSAYESFFIRWGVIPNTRFFDTIMSIPSKRCSGGAYGVFSPSMPFKSSWMI